MTVREANANAKRTRRLAKEAQIAQKKQAEDEAKRARADARAKEREPDAL